MKKNLVFGCFLLITLLTACAVNPQKSRNQIEVYLEAAENYVRMEQYKNAYTEYDKALELSIQVNGEQDYKTAEIYLEHAEYASTFDESFSDIKTAEEIFRNLDDVAGIAKSFYTYGIVYKQFHMYEEAKASFGEALNICNTSERDLVNVELDSLLQLGAMGEYPYEESIQYSERAKKLLDNVDDADKYEKAIFLFINLGNIYTNLDKWDLAISNYEAAIQYWRDGGQNIEKRQIARCFCLCGASYAVVGEYDKGIEALNNSLNLMSSLDDVLPEDYANTYRYLSAIYMVGDNLDYDKALEYGLSSCRVYIQQKELNEKELKALSVLKEELKNTYESNPQKTNQDFKSWFEENT